MRLVLRKTQGAARKTLLALAVMFGCLSAAPAGAQEWPQRTIRIIVGFAPGGGTDIVGRILAQSMQEKLGQPVVIENRPGAGGTLGAEAVARADKDGYTLGILTNGHIISGVLSNSLRYDTLTAFAPVTQIASASLAIVARRDYAANTVKELVDAARANPGKITFASAGVGGTQHFVGELFKQTAKVDMLHVPFRASPAAIAAVLSKDVDLLFDTVSAVLGQLQSGDLKALAVTGRDRFPALPEVPAAVESGVLPGFDVVTWYGMVAPAGTPAPVVAKLNATLNAILAEPEVRERLTKAGVLAQGSSADGFGAHMRSEFARWDAVRAAAGMAKQ